jgi:hypothetical protein
VGDDNTPGNPNYGGSIINFNNNPVSTQYNYRYLNLRTCNASICDTAGNLLFYTDGMKVWNRLHQPMPNGTGLNGHISSTQSAIIVPVIGDTSRYYVFTIDDYGSPQRLQYSVVNMNMDNGRGDIELKNSPIISGVSEKLTAVRHCNQRDIWIITHSTFGNTYYAFLVDPSGVHTTPAVSQAGSSYL